MLALANWPSYNPADRRTLNGNGLRNRAITDLYEPGSTLKVFTAALALDSGRYSPSSLFDAARLHEDRSGHHSLTHTATRNC